MARNERKKKCPLVTGQTFAHSTLASSTATRWRQMAHYIGPIYKHPTTADAIIEKFRKVALTSLNLANASISSKQ